MTAPPKPRVSAAAVAAAYRDEAPAATPPVSDTEVEQAADVPAAEAPAAEAPAEDAPVAKARPAAKKKSAARKPAKPPKPEPEAAEPDVVEPEAVEPEVVEPEVVGLEVVEPAIVEPAIVEPVIVEPEAGEPVTTADAVIPSETPDDADAQMDPDSSAPAPTVLSEVAADTDVPAVRLRGVAKSFGETRAVDAIDLSIPAGTFYGVVGPNGAGKTTTLSMIAGLLRPDRGTIEIAGIDLAAEPARAKRMMGILPDRLRTFDRLTGRQLLHYYGVLRGLAPAVVESRAADLARAFDLAGDLGRTVADYSAGMTKKVMLAGAMIHSPRVLVLDEPFEAVDPVSSAIILDILKAYVAHGGTVILSSHGMELVERVCSGVAVVVAGQVLAEGTVDEVRGELTLEQRFIELAGGLSDVEGLEWLHTFSG